MRYVLAIAALVLSGVLLLLGIGQRTFLAGPAEIVYRADTASDAAYAVVPGEVFQQVPGQANVVVDGENAFVATGALRDVEAWVAPYDHAELSADRQSRQLVGEAVPPAEAGGEETGDGAEGEAAEDTGDEGAAAPVDPRGSDMWLEERSADDGETDVRVPVELAEDQAVLIASDGAEPMPQELSISWVQDRRTPFAGPLLVAGGLFAVVGGVLYLLAIDHDRRGLGPRRGRRGPLQGIRNVFGGDRRAKRRSEAAAKSAGGADAGAPATPAKTERRALRRALPAAGLALALGLSGCSAGYWPDFSPAETEEDVPPEQVSNAAPVPVNDAQVDRIVQRVAEVAAAGDDDLDAEALEARFTGDALAQRRANYTIRKAVPEYTVIPPRITEETLDYELVQSTEDWPRTLFVTVASAGEEDSGTGEDDTSTEVEPQTESAPAEGEEPAEEQDDQSGEGAQSSEEEPTSPSLALVLTQATPHENYLVSRVISLRGGISMPEAAPAEEGTALLSDDLQSLTVPPGEVGTAYAAVLQQGAGAAEAELFDIEGDPLIERSGAGWVAEAKERAAADGFNMSYSATAAQGEEPTVSLSTGVGGALVATTVIENRVEAPGDGKAKPTAVGSVTALSGLTGQHDRLVREVAHQMLFFVPSKSSGAPIQVLGSTTELVGASD
ncbi:glycosyltransferase [Leucobacter sp. CSA1]|uniref:Glycosyltransferase n=1 Tax=Leucobacter chromiisoli TaxID=2796471 RepID=A0A934QBD2_9MICO|nr:glycosyltransferase [Leucobacter chromiisoli]MBK0420054.1 glycosyltransferase [Leucobacter chromiisoli]